MYAVGSTWSRFRSNLALGIAVVTILAATDSAVFIAAVAPWNVPDEPQHMAYARELWFELQDSHVDKATVEREVVDSMIRNDFHRVNYPLVSRREPDTFRDIKLIEMAVDFRAHHPKTYYWLTAMTWRLLGIHDLDKQLYAARGFSAILSVLAVGLTYMATSLVTGGRIDSALLASLVLALSPQRAFISAGVNNDNLALVAGGAILLAVAIVARTSRAIRWASALAVASAVALLLVKSTALLALALPVCVAFILSIESLCRRFGVALVAMAGMGTMLIAGLVISQVVRPCGAMGWHVSGSSSCLRVSDPGPSGDFAFRIDDQSSTVAAHAYQTVANSHVKRSVGQEFTLGLWVRAPYGSQVGYLQVFDGQVWRTKEIHATNDWHFESLFGWIAADATNVVVNFGPADSRPESLGALDFAGVVLTSGRWSGEHTIYSPEQGVTRVIWQGALVDNLLTNGDASEYVLSAPPGSPLYRESVGWDSAMLSLTYLARAPSLAHSELSGIVAATLMLVDTFWGRFGWLSISLLEPWGMVYRWVTVVLLVAGIGAAASPRLPASSRIVVLSAIVAVVVATVVVVARALPPPAFPQGRYAFAIAPSLALLAGAGLASVRESFVTRWCSALFVLILSSGNTFALLRILLAY